MDDTYSYYIVFFFNVVLKLTIYENLMINVILVLSHRMLFFFQYEQFTRTFSSHEIFII